MFTYPSVEQFKDYFYRDFPFATGIYADPETSIIDADIEKAFGEAKFNFNPRFFKDQDQFNIGFLYLTAHYLVMDLRAASQGISGQFTWLESSKSVGSVSASYGVPERIMNNPQYAWLTKTNYGAKYLMLIMPYLVGNIFTVSGRTKP